MDVEYRVNRKGRLLLQFYAVIITLLLILGSFLFVKKELLATAVKLIAIFGVLSTVTFIPLICRSLVLRIEKGSLSVTTGILFNVKRLYFVDKAVRIKRYALPISKRLGLCIVYLHGLDFTFLLPPLPFSVADEIITHFQDDRKTLN